MLFDFFYTWDKEEFTFDDKTVWCFDITLPTCLINCIIILDMTLKINSSNNSTFAQGNIKGDQMCIDSVNARFEKNN